MPSEDWLHQLQELWEQPSTDWTNPINMLEIRNAVERGEVQVNLDGHSFSIRYENDIDMVFLKRVDSFAPCGWFRISKLLKYEPEGEF